jgi:hypothetical protein
MMDDFIYGEPRAIQQQLELATQLMKESGAQMEES